MDNKTDWRIERGLELILALVIVAALVGAFGGRTEPDRARVSSGDSVIAVEYHRISRNGMAEPLVVHVRNTGDSPVNQVEIRLTRSYLEGFNLQGITPSPESELTDDRDLVLVYGALNARESKAVQISLESEFPGKHPGAVRVTFPNADPVSVRFSTRVLP